MATRLDKYQYESNTNSRVARNQKLYEDLYANDSYFKGDDDRTAQLERTNEIDIEKVRELLKGRETYRKEMKMRELNIVNEEPTIKKEEEPVQEKNYDINDFLNKASEGKVSEPYHKIDSEIEVEEEEPEEVEEKTIDELQKMGNTELSLNIFDDLVNSDDEEDEDTTEVSAVIESVTHDEDTNTVTVVKSVYSIGEEDENNDDTAFFTKSINLKEKDMTDDEEDEDDDEEESGSSLAIKIILIILVLVVVALVAYLLFA